MPVTKPLSWTSFSGDKKHVPVNCYVLTEPGRALLIDTGLPTQQATVVAQLKSLLRPDQRLSILHTRVGEYDSVGNTGPITEAFPVDRLVAFFLPEWMMDFRAEPVHPRNATISELKLAGQVLQVGEGGTRPLHLLEAPLRLLLTFWAYDSATQVLFTSDSFGHVALEDAAADRVVTRQSDSTQLASVTAYLAAKFDWLSAADRDGIKTELAEVFETYEVETIAPMHGRILRGREVVRRHYEMVQEALTSGWPEKR